MGLWETELKVSPIQLVLVIGLVFSLCCTKFSCPQPSEVLSRRLWLEVLWTITLSQVTHFGSDLTVLMALGCIMFVRMKVHVKQQGYASDIYVFAFITQVTRPEHHCLAQLSSFPVGMV